MAVRPKEIPVIATDVSGIEARSVGRPAWGAITVAFVVGLFCSFSPQVAADGNPQPDQTQVTQAQAETPAPKGLPPAPTYLPGTAITPEKKAQNKGSAVATVPPILSAELQQSPVTAGPAGGAEVAAAPTPNVQDEVWQKLLPYVPEPGHFAVIPGSELRPVLVRKDEFDFCDQIKCGRSAGVLGAWNGGAFDDGRGEFRVHGGGHSDYGGNEVYVFDFSPLKWTRETDPQPLTGPFQRDTNGDGTADACPAPAAGPPATHTYQGFLYVPKIDRYWLFGTVGYCSNGMGGSAAWAYDANNRAWTAMPELAKFAKFTRAVVDPDSGNVLVHVGREQGWHEIDPVTRRVVRSFDKDPFGSYIDGPAVFDQRRGAIYALIGGGKMDRLVAYDWPAAGKSKGFDGRLIAEWPKDGGKYWGMAQHASGVLVLWDGNTRILVVDPDSGKSWEERTAGFPSGSTGANDKASKVYSKWSYIPQVDAFFGITNVDLGVVLYRLGGSAVDTLQPSSNSKIGESASKTDGVEGIAEHQSQDLPSPALPVAAIPKQRAASPLDNSQPAPREIDATASWDKVCATAVLCEPMGEGDVLYRRRIVETGLPKKGNKWRSIGQKFNHPQAQAPAPDPDVGGLRFTFPSNSGSGDAGNFKTDFSPDYSFQIGPVDAGAPAQEAYIQFQVRYSCTFIWTDCDPASSNYRKERRCFLSKRGEGKCTVSKIALISTGDRDGLRADACTRIQIALNHDVDHSLHAFHRCPQALGFGEKLARVNGRSQGNSQPNGVYYCPRILDGGSARGWNNSADSCFGLIDDRWITIQVHLKFGPWQAKPKKNDTKLSHVSIWAAVEGEDGGRQRLVIDNDFAPTTPEHPNDFIGKIWLMPHLYDKSDKEEHPPFYVWYRNLVVSESMIPNPS